MAETSALSHYSWQETRSHLALPWCSEFYSPLSDVRNRVVRKERKETEEQSRETGSRKQVHLSSAVGTLQGLIVIALRPHLAGQVGVTESRCDSGADKHPTLCQLATLTLLLRIYRPSLKSLNIFKSRFLADTLF